MKHIRFLRNKPLGVTREKRSFPDVVEATEQHDNSLQPHSEPAMWRCTVPTQAYSQSKISSKDKHKYMREIWSL
jgi:hypothetical protein